MSRLTLVALLSVSASFAAAQSSFTLMPNGAVEAKIGYFPVAVTFSATKPAGITKEPVYKATPRYAVLKMGNGPKSSFTVAVDEPDGQPWKIYIDKNQDGDLTNDGDEAWVGKTTNSRTMYGVLNVTLRASYGDATNETSSAPYQVGLYEFAGKSPAENRMFMYRESSRNGTVSVDGKTHKAILVENDADGLYNKTVTSADDAGKSRPVWLMLDANDDGKWTMLDIRAPFKLGDTTYEATPSIDGSTVNFAKTDKPALDLAPKQAVAPPLLKPGTAAPEFVAEKWGGGNLKLSDYKGKVVILDFWATWCGPCQHSMPHIEKVKQALKNRKDVVIIGICVWDEKAAYSQWVPKNKDKYTFQFAFDPAGSDNAKSIASKLFMVSGIPTTYIIGKDGKIADSIVGYDDGDTRVEASLAKLGVKVDTAAPKSR